MLKRDWKDRIKDIEEANEKERRKKARLGEKVPSKANYPDRLKGGGRVKSGKKTISTQKPCDMCGARTHISRLTTSESGLKFCKKCAKSKGLI